MSLFRFLFLGELGTCPQNLMPAQGVEPSENHQFQQRGYAEIHIQRPFSDNKNSIYKSLRMRIRTVGTCCSAFSIRRNFYFWKILKSRFLVEFQSFIFDQILAVPTVSSSFRQILLHWQWLTACPNFTCSGSLQSYYQLFSTSQVSSTWCRLLHQP
jgi:hypothetical protein